MTTILRHILKVYHTEYYVGLLKKGLKSFCRLLYVVDRKLTCEAGGYE